jgi:hypothetical protein
MGAQSPIADAALCPLTWRPCRMARCQPPPLYDSKRASARQGRPGRSQSPGRARLRKAIASGDVPGAGVLAAHPSAGTPYEGDRRQLLAEQGDVPGVGETGRP